MSTIALRADQIRTRSPQWLIGMLADSNYLNDCDSAVNSDPQSVDVWTIEVAAASNSFDYQVTVDGTTVTYTSDPSATVLEIAQGLRAALNVEPIIGARFIATDDGVDTITLTGLTPGDVGVVTDNTGDLTTTHTTTAASAESIAFGRLVMPSSPAFDDGAPLCKLAKSSTMTAQVDTLTVDFAAGERYTVSLAIEGRTYSVDVLADTDDATTATAIRAAINAIMPANSVVASGATDQVILTGEVAGKVFVTALGLVSGTTARLALAYTTVGTDVNDALGISLHTYDESDTEIETDTIVYPANAGVHFARSARVAVASSETVTNGGKVYVELGVTADNGKFFATTSATRVLLSRCKWERNEDSSADDDVAVLRIRPAA